MYKQIIIIKFKYNYLFEKYIAQAKCDINHTVVKRTMDGSG